MQRCIRIAPTTRRAAAYCSARQSSSNNLCLSLINALSLPPPTAACRSAVARPEGAWTLARGLRDAGPEGGVPSLGILSVMSEGESPSSGLSMGSESVGPLPSLTSLGVPLVNH